jgi:Fe-S cluster biogenesis protein NfuA
VLRTEIAPALELDGADLEVLDVSDGIAKLRLTGACASCPATILPLITSLEAELSRRFPSIEYIEAVA